MIMTIPEFPSAWLPILDSVVKATLVLGAAAVAAHALRRASAALRHLIWTLALVSALLMPVLSMALPRWQLPILNVASPEQMRIGSEEPRALAPPLRSPAADRARLPEPAPAASPVPPTPVNTSPAYERIASLSWPRILGVVWALGFLLLVGRVIVGVIAVQWMARRSQRVLDAPWMKAAVALASEVGVSGNITFLRSEGAAMPLACGVLRPAVMMPAEADDWPADRLRIVLLHELAHVKRRDCLTHIIAQLACAFHWFNPLAWVAARNVRTERERACDDLVLAAGTRPPDYADQLLDIARAMRADRYPAAVAGASLAMAHRSHLEGRLMAILDPRVPHSALSRLRAGAAAVVCCAAVVPLAALQPWGPETPTARVNTTISSPSETASASPVPAPAPAPGPVPRWADVGATAAAIAGSVAAPAVEAALGGVLGRAVVPHSADQRGAMLGPIVGEHNRPNHSDSNENESSNANDSNDESDEDDDEVQDSQPASAKSDPRMVAALTAALKDTDKEVRETALQALVRLRDPSIFEPLLQALKDAVPDVREKAAFGLGQLRDRRAIEPLSAALKDEHADVRQQAAFALSQLRDRTAIPALTAALKDADAEVREHVVFALAQIRDPATIEAFTFALRDANASVREKAAFGLGQLRDRRAVEPLISALKDSDADVREHAAFALGQLRDRGAVEALVIALKDSSANVREKAAFALGQLGDARAIDGLTTALKDPQAGVRQKAAFALGQLAR
jgi:HEAT repeat protein/beta-lactamase regulating signal transducer with metallopeptidase domain